jgi:hypothetical protein
VKIPAAEHRFIRALCGHGYSYHVLKPLKAQRRIRCQMYDCGKPARWVYWARPILNGTLHGTYFYHFCGEHKPVSFEVPLGPRRQALGEVGLDLLKAARLALHFLPQSYPDRPGCPPSAYSQLKAAVELAEKAIQET